MANISVAFITKSPRSFFLPVATIVPVALYCGSLASYAHRAPQNDPPHESMQRGTQVGHPNLGSPSEKENHRFGHSTGRLQKSMESMSRGATTALPSEDANLRNHWGSIAWLEPCPIDPPSRQTLADAGRQHQIGLAKFLDDLGFHVPNAAAVATPKHVCRTAYLS